MTNERTEMNKMSYFLQHQTKRDAAQKSIRIATTVNFLQCWMTVYSSIISIFNWSWRLHESFSRSNKKQSSWSFFVLFPAADFHSKNFRDDFCHKTAILYSSFVQVLHPEIKGPTPRCQAWLIYIYCKHPKHWFEWLCRFAREILDTLRGKLKTWIGKKT